MTSTGFTTSTEAENAFYAAFSRGDLEAMRDIWLDASYTSCVHPMGDRLLGTPAIIKSWETILKNTGDVIIELSDLSVHEGPQTAIHTLIENIHVQDETEKMFQFIATNVYEQTSAGWKMILHHASPMPRDISQEKDPRPVVH